MEVVEPHHLEQRDTRGTKRLPVPGLEYPDAAPSQDIGDLLQALDDDVSGAFWG